MQLTQNKCHELILRPRTLAGLLLLALAVSPATVRAATINFDDVDATAGDVLLTTYQGYSWTNISVYTATPGFPGFNSGIVSSPNAAYTSGDSTLGVPVTSSISDSSGYFNVVSAEVGAGWYNGLTVTFVGLTNGAQAFSQTFTVNTTGATLVSFNFTGINQLQIVSATTPGTTDPYGCGTTGCSQVTLDDVILTPSSGPAPNGSPEPSTFFALALGSASLLLMQRQIRIRARHK